MAVLTRTIGGTKFYLHTRTDFKRQAVALAKRLRTPATKARVIRLPEANGWGVFTHPKRR